MKAFCVTLMLCAMACSSPAQNWQCVQPNQKVYFRNYFSYLRGMRIDSTRITANATTWYPFHSPRGGNYWLNNSTIDPNGGSWLGRSITAQNGGSTFFMNEFGDTVVIDTHAGPGAQWTFYSDTSSLWFQATVTSADTLTIAGTIDSVKRIGIQGKIGNANVASISDGIDVLLSKNHGIIRAFDFDVFPFPGYVGSGSTDYLTGVISFPNGGNPYSDLSFSRVEMYNPGGNAIFDYQPGDILEYDVNYGPYAGSITTDTILSRQNAGPWLNYTIRRHEYNDSFNNGGSVFYTASSTYNFQTSYLPLAVDTALMPEETGNPWFYYYILDDTSQCVTGPAYQRVSCNIEWNTHIAHGYAYCRTVETFKPGFGWLTHQKCDANDEYLSDFVKYLRSTRKNNITCGTLAPLSVALPVKSALGFTVYPNPAHAGATISLHFPSGASGSLVTVLDLDGRMVYSGTTSGSLSQTISTIGWLPGIYIVRLQTQDGIAYRKLVIAQ